MIDENMVERVARVLEPQAWAALAAGDTRAYEHRRTSSLRKARKAIVEMREPTEAMVDAADLESMPIRPDWHWRTMIDAALKEPVT